jgi:hypothetical protein
MTGPFGTERQARESPAVRAVYAEFDRDPGPGQMIAPNTAMITRACDAAGVKLGDWDRRIVTWLAGWEPATCAVFACLVSRAALTDGQRELLAAVLADAVDRREPSGACTDCEKHPAGLCWDHNADLDRCDAYLELARQLGIEVDR